MLIQWQNIFHVIVHGNLLVQYVTQIKNGMIKHDNLNVIIIVSARKIVRILAHVFVRIVSIQTVLLIIHRPSVTKL